MEDIKEKEQKPKHRDKIEALDSLSLYFDGNVTSRTFIDIDGSKKSLGIMMIGEYLFGTAEAEIMGIIEGHVEVRLKAGIVTGKQIGRAHV